MTIITIFILHSKGATLSLDSGTGEKRENYTNIHDTNVFMIVKKAWKNLTVCTAPVNFGRHPRKKSQTTPFDLHPPAIWAT